MKVRSVAIAAAPGRTHVAAGLAPPWLSSALLSLIVSLVLVLFYNVPFWVHVLGAWTLSLRGVGFLASLFLLLVAGFNALLVPLSFKFVQKPAIVAILISAATATYFTNVYGVMLDVPMVRSLFETDRGEAGELIDVRLLLWVLGLGVVPSILVCCMPVRYERWRQAWVKRVGALGFGAAALALAGGVFYSDFASFFRNHDELRHLVTPTNLVYGTIQYLQDSGPVTVQPLGTDAHLGARAGAQARPTLAILVVGETARARNFSLNGYERETNPILAQEKIVNFENARSCGTATAVSLPCMFSHLGREHFSIREARRHEGLLDVVAHAGLDVLWRDNNTGCKGACDRIKTERGPWLPEGGANGDESFDEHLLDGLDAYLDSVQGHALIVLHQQGSHGPAYYLRYPERFDVFVPTCETGDLPDCDAQEIINAYDNTILYTDYFLSRVIEFLSARSDRYNTAMIYMSDHGESLGEDGIYLHGLPEKFAPNDQTWVPLIVWLSDGIKSAFEIDSDCLSRRRAEPLSHDWLFHSVLGLLDVQTSVHDPALDLFAGCRTAAPSTP